MSRRASWVGRAAPLALSLLGLAGAYAACVQSSASSYGPTKSATGASTASSSAAGATSFDKHALLEQIANNVILAEYQAMVKAADELAAATLSYAKAPSGEDKEQAQDAWRSAMKVWQRAELMQVGPAAPMGIPGGKDLRDGIYSWPSVNRCAVDQELVKGEYTDAAVFANKLVNVRGLATLEYLLFYSGTSNACAPQNTINQDGSWKAIEETLGQRRADYAMTLAALVATDTRALRDAWDPTKGNFVAELATPGASYGGETRMALDAVAYAFLYLDTETKDRKLAVPAGLSECPSDTCPEALESTFAAFSKAEIRENLVGFQRLFHGGAVGDEHALGFDDWLDAVGAKELTSVMAADIAAALAQVDAIAGDDLARALLSDKGSVEALYYAVKKITDNLKSQFNTVLDLHPPVDGPTDND